MGDDAVGTTAADDVAAGDVPTGCRAAAAAVPTRQPADAVCGLVADTVPFSWVDGPGNRFAVFLQGCGFNCIACHNPHTIAAFTPRARLRSVAGVLDEIRPRAAFLSGITVSGGEATQQPEFVRALFAAVRADRQLSSLTTYIDSNGDAEPRVWHRLLPVTDGTMIDLKALDPQVHQRLTGRTNDRVLASLRLLAKAGMLYEVRLLLVPGINDADDQLRATAEFLLALDPRIRVKVIGFRAHGVRAEARSWPEPTAEQRGHYGSVLTGHGIAQVVTV